jgi:hypothetical protein
MFCGTINVSVTVYHHLPTLPTLVKGLSRAMSNDTPMKRCSKCKIEKPATPEYFSRARDKKDGFTSACKVCQHEFYLANKDVIAIKGREYYQKNKVAKIEYSQQYYQANKDAVAKSAREYRQKNKEAFVQYNREYYQENKEAIAQYLREYRQENKETIAKNMREYYQVNKEIITENSREYQRKWRQKNPDKSRIKTARRQARKRSLPDTFTVEQWLICLEYHHYCCAVCGCQLRDLFGNVEPNADHWYPLSVDGCPGTIADNMICLCNSCNSSKKNKPPAIWLTEKYGTRKANEILQRISDYFEWVRSQNE